ncbi:dephospho-CoA kinase [Atopococcus tabaci]|uniref:dephospho-CoA kinase n=1 Tax=Atopococcus tabaci TaxID=269774 RepID=UPI0004136092|nr:dephospho-CoA kinase [Atopococcus tabaci]
MIIGLTGGIASGKSTVSEIFKEYGFPVIDADLGAREVVKKGSKGLQRIRAYFGEKVLFPDGTLNRSELGKEVFSDETKREALNQMLAQDIREWIEQQTKQALEEGVPLVVLDIPLLFEAGYDQKTDKTMVVFVDEDIQLERLIRRNGMTREEALNRIHAQMPLKEKMTRADYLIDNNGTIKETKKQVEDWLQKQGFLS